MRERERKTQREIICLNIFVCFERWGGIFTNHARLNTSTGHWLTGFNL